MPTLLQLNSAANWGSVGRIAEQIGLKAIAAGWESYIIYGRREYANSSRNHLFLSESRLGVYEHYFEHRVLDREGLASRRSTQKVVEEIKSIKPDVIQLHSIHDHWLNYEILFSYLATTDIPVVWTQHDQWAMTGHCCSNLVGCERWKTECYDCPLSKWYSLDRSRRNFNLKKNLCAGLKSLTIVSVSEWLADNIRQSHLKDRPIEVIHNGIDINIFRPQVADREIKYNIGSKIMVLGVSSVWCTDKGLADFIKLSENEEFQVVLVGVNNGIRKQLSDNIIAIDRTQNQQELAMLFSMADVSLSLSSFETFGLTIIEAMACGTPCIVYDNTAQPSLITKETGRVVKTGDIKSLAALIREFRDTDFKKHHSADCRRRAEEFFDKDKCFEKYIDLYEGLLK